MGHQARPSASLGVLAPMITGELKGKVDRIWDAFWSGGIAGKPLCTMETFTVG